MEKVRIYGSEDIWLVPHAQCIPQ